MRLVCTLTGASVESEGAAAERLIASGCFAPSQDAKEATEPAPKRRASTKTKQSQEG